MTQETSRMLKESLGTGCSKTSRSKAPEIPRNEAYISVRHSNEG
jgi:hypothetical protein